MQEYNNIIDEASDKFEILKSSESIIGSIKSLESAEILSLNIVKDEVVAKKCNEDTDAAQKRDNLLLAIDQWINKTITEYLNKCNEHIVNPPITSYYYNDGEEGSSKIIDMGKYIKKKAKLLTILHDTIESNVFSEEENESLRTIQHKLQSDAFFLAIQGHFQHGKSTFFNSIFDGRSINPIGSGIKTSAGIVFGHSISSEEQEYAKVKFLSKEQLSLMFYPLISNLNIDELKNIGITDESSIDLSNKDHIELLKSAILKRWNDVRALRAGTDRDNIDAELRILDIRLNFYTHEIIQNLYKLNTSSISIDQVKSLTRFPEEWEELWSKLLQQEIGEDLLSNKMDVDYLKFAFIDRIDVYGHSEILNELGAIIIDCPGYGDSTWDDLLADSVLLNSDAVIAIIKSDEALDYKSAELINYIRLLDSIKGRLFVLRNTSHRNPRSLHERIVEHDKAYLRSKGFETPRYYTTNLRQFHLAKMGYAYLNGILTDDEKQTFIEKCKQDKTADYDSSFGSEEFKQPMPETVIDSFESAWIDIVTQYIDPSNDSAKKALVLDKYWVDALMKVSRMPDFLNDIKQFLIEQKGITLLYDKGINVITRILDCRFNQNKKTISDMCLAQEQFEEELFRTISDTNDYINKSKDKVNGSINEKVMANETASHFCENKIFSEQAIENVSNELSELIYENLWTTIGLFTHEEISASEQNYIANKALEASIGEVCKKTFDRIISIWQMSIMSGNDYNLKNEIIEKFEVLINDLNKSWWAIQNDSLKSFYPEFKLVLGNPDVNINAYGINPINLSIILTSVSSFLLKTLVNILSVILTPIENVINVIARWFGGTFNITGTIKRKAHDYAVGIIKEKIKDSMKSNLSNSDIKNNIISEVAKIPESLISKQKKSLIATLDELAEKSNQDVTNRRNAASRDVEDRMHQKIEAVKEIEAHILPLFMNCKSFYEQ